jgi:hypothetical protein
MQSINVRLHRGKFLTEHSLPPDPPSPDAPEKDDEGQHPQKNPLPTLGTTIG